MSLHLLLPVSPCLPPLQRQEQMGNQVLGHKGSQYLHKQLLLRPFRIMILDLDKFDLEAISFEVTTQNTVASVTFGELKPSHPPRNKE